MPSLTFLLRTDDPELIEGLQEMADAEGRSMNKQLERILKESLEAWRKEKANDAN